MSEEAEDNVREQAERAMEVSPGNPVRQTDDEGEASDLNNSVNLSGSSTSANSSCFETAESGGHESDIDLSELKEATSASKDSPNEHGEGTSSKPVTNGEAGSSTAADTRTDTRTDARTVAYNTQLYGDPYAEVTNGEGGIGAVSLSDANSRKRRFDPDCVTDSESDDSDGEPRRYEYNITIPPLPPLPPPVDFATADSDDSSTYMNINSDEEFPRVPAICSHPNGHPMNATSKCSTLPLLYLRETALCNSRIWRSSATVPQRGCLQQRSCSAATPWAWRSSFVSSLQLIRRLEKFAKLDYHQGCVNALNFNESGTRLISGSDDLNIAIWDWARRKRIHVFDSKHRSNVFQTKYMPGSGDMLIASCARDGAVRLSNLTPDGVCSSNKKLVQHKGSAHKLSVDTGQPMLLLSCGEDASVFQCDLRHETAVKLVSVQSIGAGSSSKVPLYSIDSNPVRPEQFLVTGRDQYLRIYDRRNIRENEPLKKFCPELLVDHERYKANITCGAFNYDGSRVLATYNDEDIYLFDTSHSDGADAINKYFGHRNSQTVKGINFFGLRSEYVVSGSDCGHVYLWDTESAVCVQSFHADDGGVVNVLEPHPSLCVLATSGLDNDVKLWMPTAEKETCLCHMHLRMRRNKLERKRDQETGPDFMDSSLLFMLVRRMQRSRARLRRAAEDNSDSDEVYSRDSDGDDSSSDESEEELPDQCTTS